MVHKDICISFVITDKNNTEHSFEAVGFLDEGENSIEAGEAVRRAGEGVVRDGDWELLSDNTHRFPEMLLQFRYLLTGCEGEYASRDHPMSFSRNQMPGGVWGEEWDGMWSVKEDTLVLRRV